MMMRMEGWAECPLKRMKDQGMKGEGETITRLTMIDSHEIRLKLTKKGRG